MPHDVLRIGQDVEHGLSVWGASAQSFAILVGKSINGFEGTDISLNRADARAGPA